MFLLTRLVERTNRSKQCLHAKIYFYRKNYELVWSSLAALLRVTDLNATCNYILYYSGLIRCCFFVPFKSLTKFEPFQGLKAKIFKDRRSLLTEATTLPQPTVQLKCPRNSNNITIGLKPFWKYSWLNDQIIIYQAEIGVLLSSGLRNLKFW